MRLNDSYQRRKHYSIITHRVRLNDSYQRRKHYSIITHRVRLNDSYQRRKHYSIITHRVRLNDSYQRRKHYSIITHRVRLNDSYQRRKHYSIITHKVRLNDSYHPESIHFHEDSFPIAITIRYPCHKAETSNVKHGFAVTKIAKFIGPTWGPTLLSGDWFGPHFFHIIHDSFTDTGESTWYQ